MIKGYLTLKEAAEVSGINVEALKKRCQEGKIRGALKKGNSWFVPRGEVVVDDQSTTDGSLGLILTFVEGIKDGGVSFGITVFVNGLAVSGNLVSRETYLKKFGEDLVSNVTITGFDGAEEYQNKINDTIQTYVGSLLEYKEEGTPTFIHMTDINLLSGENEIMNLKAANLRLRVSAIDGFMLGRVDRAKENG